MQCVTDIDGRQAVCETYHDITLCVTDTRDIARCVTDSEITRL